MPVNQQHFEPPLATDTLLRVRGFNNQGIRSGGIKSPKIVDLQAGTILFRFFHDPSKRYGEWWCTPYELKLISSYFARSAPAFDEGRSGGKGILHGTLAVRHDWGSMSPLHLGQYFAVSLTSALRAYFGEGDHAPDATQTHVQKTVMIIDHQGRQRPARQVFLPKPWTYQNAFREVDAGSGDAALLTAVSRLAGPPAPFER